MKKLFSLLLAGVTFCSIALTVGCGKSGTKRYEDTRNLTEQEYTLANITATDQLGRLALAGDERNNSDVGVFYHTWHGAHETPGQVLDITKILKENPDYLGSDYLTVNRQAFHYWGEPLYGYYDSDDPWLITRHVEIMTAIGFDYVAYDFTNASSYTNTAIEIFKVLQKYYDQGFDVPKVTFYTNTASANVICQLYREIYEKGLYKDLWYAPNGKPFIIGVYEDTVSQANKTLFYDIRDNYFDFKETQWPDGKTTIDNFERGWPWMNWCFPQLNYNGMMSVSLAQHPGAKMSHEERMNYGRGYDWEKMRNYSKNSDWGTNYQGQWQTVYDNNADKTKQKITQVFVTGFNEWMAQKLNDGNDSFFVDNFSEEYSRDIEMMKGGYGDNYVIQTLMNNRQFRYTPAKHYKYNFNTITLDNLEGWLNVKSVYRDFEGDAMARNFADAFRTTTYVDNSNRNDIVSVSVTHDKTNLYVKVTTSADITAYDGTSENWMNLLIKTKDDNVDTFGGFDYLINRQPAADGTTTIEKCKVGGGYAWESKGSANYYVNGKNIIYSIPLKALGLTQNNCYVRIKASDNVTAYQDIMDYYVTGDSAPIGRFAYAYGY